jgi:hypothetical protein
MQNPIGTEKDVRASLENIGKLKKENDSKNTVILRPAKKYERELHRNLHYTGKYFTTYVRT